MRDRAALILNGVRGVAAARPRRGRRRGRRRGAAAPHTPFKINAARSLTKKFRAFLAVPDVLDVLIVFTRFLDVWDRSGCLGAIFIGGAIFKASTLLD